jgi:DivIVA domain-containing protein
MPLTPAEVHNVAFKKPSIGKRGYDEDEVDAFLDLVEAELSRLIEENAELSARVAGSETGAPAPQSASAPPTVPVQVSAADTGAQAARLLGLAQETADKLTAEAKAESDKMLADAKGQADALVTDATARAEATERDSRIRAENLDREAKTRYDDVLGKLSSDKVGLEQKIEELRTYEREYRGRLKSWITDQLAQLDGGSREQQPAAATAKPAE